MKTMKEKGISAIPSPVAEEHKNSRNYQTGGHFKMIRNLSIADCISLGNMACGMTAIFICVNYYRVLDTALIYQAFGFILLGWFLDTIDGPIARARKTNSSLGRELDSFADGITFAIAPSLIAYVTGFNSGLDGLVLVLFVACCISRLSRFNATSEEFSFGSNIVKLILGLPTASSLLPTGIIVILLWTNNLWMVLELGKISFQTYTLHIPVLLYLFLGLLMISDTIRFTRPGTKITP